MSGPLVTERLVTVPQMGRGAPGLSLAGKYVLQHEIGQGGMGSVWRAERLGWDAPVAVKLMLPDLHIRQERFEHEVSAAARVRCQNVVQVFDHGFDAHLNAPFIVMELLTGESVARRLDRLGSLSPREVFTIVAHVGNALTRAHGQGIIHRDLKPDNLFLVAEAEPLIKVLDFGLAKSIGPEERALTGEGRVMGTPGYVSPEQLVPSKGPRDHRIDLWSLAIIACECLTGRKPFAASDTPSLAIELWSEERPVPSSLGRVPVGFDEWFARATHRSIEARFQTAAELVAALRPICGIQANERLPPIVYEQQPRAGARSSQVALSRTQDATTGSSARRRRLLVSIAVASVVGGVALNAFLLTRPRHPNPVPNAASPPAVTTAALTPAPAPPASPQSAAAAPPAPVVSENAPPTGKEPSDAIAAPPEVTVAPATTQAPRPTRRQPRSGRPRLPQRSAPTEHPQLEPAASETPVDKPPSPFKDVY